VVTGLVSKGLDERDPAMLLNTLKWLSWPIAVALIGLLFLFTALTARLGLPELVITVMLVGITSLPGSIIHSAQSRR
jgi:uncharacterized membrane protein YjjP (DUF1212 family)